MRQSIYNSVLCILLLNVLDAIRVSAVVDRRHKKSKVSRDTGLLTAQVRKRHEILGKNILFALLKKHF